MSGTQDVVMVKSKYSNIEAFNVKRLKETEQGSHRLKQMYANFKLKRTNARKMHIIENL